MDHENAVRELISESRVDVFSLALDLVGDRDAAEEVVEEVFLRVYHALPLGSQEDDVAPMIHRYTYDAALPRLLGRIERQSTMVESASRDILRTTTVGQRYLS